ATLNLSIDSQGMPGMVGLDAMYSGASGSGYEDFAWWNGDGQMERSLVAPNKDAAGRSLTQVRYELYPKPTPTTNEDTYNPWTVDVGGVHVQVDSGGAGWGGIGTVH